MTKNEFFDLIKTLIDAQVMVKPTDIYKLQNNTLLDLYCSINRFDYSSDIKEKYKSIIKNIFKKEKAFCVDDVIPTEFKAVTYGKEANNLLTNWFVDLKQNSTKYAKKDATYLKENQKLVDKGISRYYKEIDALEKARKLNKKNMKRRKFL
jgi:hypothetical protein